MEHQWVAINEYESVCLRCGITAGSWEMATHPMMKEYNTECTPKVHSVDDDSNNSHAGVGEIYDYS